MVTAMVFDTLKLAEQLETEAGFDAPRARAMARILADNTGGNLATREDILIAKGELHADIQGVRDAIHGLKNDLEAQIQRVSTGLKEEIHGIKGSLEAEIQRVSTGLRDEIHGIEGGLKDEIQRVSTGLRDEIHGIEGDLKDEIQRVSTGLRDEIHGIEGGLNGKIQRVDISLKHEIQELRGDVRVLYWISGTTLTGVAALLSIAIAMALHVMHLN